MTKIAFIVSYDNELYFSECIDYISCLKVPEGIETEIVGIADAESIAGSYNAAMHETKAKYKVYLHQDVFIINENFIADVIEIFEQNLEYGMLGVIGSNKFIANADYHMQWNVGMAILDHSVHSNKVMNENPDRLCEAVAADGMILITQYDVEWKEDVYDGFDFYDISQCLEFQKAGYKVGIPHQKEVWCNYVPIQIDLQNYNFYRKRFCEDYREFGYQFALTTAIKNYNIKAEEMQEIIPLIENALMEKDLDRAEAFVDTAKNFSPNYIPICELYEIVQMIQIEKKHGIEHNFYANILSMPDLLELHTAYKFLLKRLEYGKPLGVWNDLLHLIAKNATVGLDAEKIVAESAVLKDDQVIWKLKRILTRLCSRDFRPQFDDKVFLLPVEEAFDEIRSTCSDIQTMIPELLASADQICSKKDRQTVEQLFETINDVFYKLHIGRISEDLYMAYLDVVEESKNVALFAERCQEWVEQVLRYIDRQDQRPLVSVLTSVYNGESFIEDTLRSIMQQSYQNLEIIVADDGSSDNSRAVIERLAQCDKRIHPLFLNENSNVCNAINMTYKLARGKYIALIGHDDIWAADKIEKQVSFMEMYPEYAVCFTLVNIIDDEKKQCNERAAELYYIFNQKNRSREQWVQTLLLHNVLCAPSALIRKKCIKGDNIYHFGIVQLQDFALWLELLSEHPIYVMQERLMFYRKFFKSSSNLSASNPMTQNRLEHENNYVRWNYIKTLPDEAFCFLFQKHFRNPSAEGTAELKCERAFMMQDWEDLHCIDMFMELFEDEETRNILEDKYDFKLRDFYVLNTKSFSYDSERNRLLLNAQDIIHQYEAIIGKQQEAIQQYMLSEKNLESASN